MTHLSSFEIASFRNVRPTKLKCRRGLNVVLGKNAAGKTTLLRLLATSISPIRTPALDQRDVAFTLSSDEGSLSVRTLQVAATTPLSQLPTGNTTEEFELSGPTMSPPLRVKAEDGWLHIENQGPVRSGTSALISLLEHLQTADPGRFRLLLTFALPNAYRLDESLEYFNALVGFGLTQTPAGLVPTLWAGQPRSFKALFDKPLQIEPTGFRASAPFATRAAKVMGYDSAETLFDVESKTTGAGVETTLRNLRFVFKSRKDTFNHSSLSYGEKRLLAFFALSDATEAIMIVDELVNGLHHEWIKACLDEIGTRQAFLTSQNPLLLDYLEFESAEDVRDGFILCERVREPESGFAELIWRNPTDAEAQEFFAAYETGVQRVSDILISKGFW